ncbi:hypothetical protein RRG08_005647 [Elysia crispata]|uniref:Uncharacterized protein n=1 Tax=Elysia crispata TaxID=231223 RepID=A0AAE1EBZ1_9GAST|nr:hypothetical protein RRG08_005647 [Elysia crispata]
MTLSGVYCHCGNSYSIFSKKDRETLQSKTVALLCSLEARFKKCGITCPFGTGSTPTCSLPIFKIASYQSFIQETISFMTMMNIY